jgi:hypothetical protein
LSGFLSPTRHFTFQFQVGKSTGIGGLFLVQVASATGDKSKTKAQKM